MKRVILLLIVFMTVLLYAESSVRAEIDFDYENTLTTIKDTPFNEKNEADIDWYNHALFNNINLECMYFKNFYFSLKTDTRLKYLLSEWNLEYTSSSGLFSIGLYNNPIQFNPAKILMSANYFEWLYKTKLSDSNVTNIKFQLFFNNSALKIIYAPNYEWMYKTNLEDYIRKNIESVYYVQYQFFNDFLDFGSYFSIEGNHVSSLNYNCGLWTTLSLNEDISVYNEFSWTSRKWIPYLTTEKFEVILKNNIGIRDTFGISKSFYTIPFTLYAEFKYNSDGYYIKEWNDLKKTCEFYDKNVGAYSSKIKASLLKEVDYLDFERFTIALHLRQDAYFFDLFKLDSTLVYFMPETFLLKESVVLNLKYGFSASYELLLPFSVKNTMNYSSLYPYKINNTFKISYKLFLEK